MCGPTHDEKSKLAFEKFSEEFESAFVESVCIESKILPATSRIFSGDTQSIPETASPHSRRKKTKNRRLLN